jgi:hypothetical protein
MFVDGAANRRFLHKDSSAKTPCVKRRNTKAAVLPHTRGRRRIDGEPEARGADDSRGSLSECSASRPEGLCYGGAPDANCSRAGHPRPRTQQSRGAWLGHTARHQWPVAKFPPAGVCPIHRRRCHQLSPATRDTTPQLHFDWSYPLPHRIGVPSRLFGAGN